MVMVCRLSASRRRAVQSLPHLLTMAEAELVIQTARPGPWEDRK